MALPEIKDKRSTDDLSYQNKSQGKFFDRLLMTEFGKDKISSNRNTVSEFIERNKGDDDQKRMIRRIANNTDEMVLLLRNMQLEDKKNKGFEEQTQNVYGNGHTSLFADMIDAIKNDRDPYVDGKAGREALELVLAIYKSAAEGRPVKLPIEKCKSIDFKGRF